MKARQPSKHIIPERVLERVWDRIEYGDWLDCWPWTASRGSHGYGQIGWQVGGGRNAGTTAHRAVWVAINGQIPVGMTVDHLCRNRPCCNPLHLRLLSNVENARDNQHANKTHCPSGHEYAGENLYVSPKGHRRCRACVVERKAA